LVRCDRHEGGAGFGRGHREAGIVGRHIDFAQEAVRGLEIIEDAGQPELLGQPILQDAEQPLRAPPRLRRTGGDMFDTQLRQRPPDLGESAPGDLPASFRRMEVMAAAVAVRAE
jgi:hypothetical protein